MSEMPASDAKPTPAGSVAPSLTLRQQNLSLKSDTLKISTKSFTKSVNSSLCCWKGAMNENMPPATNNVFANRREVTDILLEQLLGCEAAVSKSAKKAILSARMVKPLSSKPAGDQIIPSSPTNTSPSDEQSLRQAVAKKVAQETPALAAPAIHKAGATHVEVSRGALNRAIDGLESAFHAKAVYATAPPKKGLSAERAVFFLAQVALDLGLAEEAATAAEEEDRERRRHQRKQIKKRMKRNKNLEGSRQNETAVLRTGGAGN